MRISDWSSDVCSSDLRPQECRTWNCGWLEFPEIPDHWQPARCHMVLYVSEGGSHIDVHVDPAYPEAWKLEPYYTQLRDWAAERYPPHPGTSNRNCRPPSIPPAA